MCQFGVWSYGGAEGHLATCPEVSPHTGQRRCSAEVAGVQERRRLCVSDAGPIGCRLAHTCRREPVSFSWWGGCRPQPGDACLDLCEQACVTTCGISATCSKRTEVCGPEICTPASITHILERWPAVVRNLHAYYGIEDLLPAAS